MYNTMFKEEYENMCPVITKNITVKEKCPWFNGDIEQEKEEERLKRNGKDERQVKIGRVTKVKGIM